MSSFREANPQFSEPQTKGILKPLLGGGLEHACLGLYLSSRIDLLPAELCRELAQIRDAATPMPATEVQEIMAHDLGNQWQKSFAEFDYAPFESSMVAQSHRAQLRNGTPVRLVILRSRFHALKCADALEACDREVLNGYCGDRAAGNLLTDFAAALERKKDFLASRQALELMAIDAASLELLGSRKTFAELSGSKVMTVERLEEQPLSEVLKRQPHCSEMLARRICQVWLHLSLRGHCFPVDPQLHNILVRDTNQTSFLNCDLASLSAGTQDNLATYLNAILADNPDRASVYLLREMEYTKGAKIDFDSLRSSFRQAAYFGMLEPVLGSNSNALAQIVFQHWKSALEHGYSPKPHLLWFYRGLFSMARIAYRLFPTGDPLRDGLMELRMGDTFDQVRTIMGWQHWYQNSDKFASALLNLPRALDDALSTPESPRLPEAAHDESPYIFQKRNLVSTIVILLLVLALSQLPQVSVWPGKTTTVAVMLAGLLALRRLDM